MIGLIIGIVVAIITTIYSAVGVLVYKKKITRDFVIWKPFSNWSNGASPQETNDSTNQNSDNVNINPNTNTAKNVFPGETIAIDTILNPIPEQSNESNSTNVTTNAETTSSTVSTTKPAGDDSTGLNTNTNTNTNTPVSSTTASSDSTSTTTTTNPVNNIECLVAGSTFASVLLDGFPSYESLSNTQDQNKISNFCKAGQKALSCKSKIVSPLNEVKFQKYCCDGNIQLCTDVSQKCIIEKAKLHNLSYDFSNINKESFDSIEVQQKLQSFYDAGKDIMENGCAIDEFHPLNDSNYIKYCCNNQSKENECNSKSMECTINKSVFANEAYTFKQFNNSSLTIASNAAKLTSFCALGKQIQNSGCAIDELHPLNNADYVKYCCGGKVNFAACTEESLKCVFDSAEYLDKEPGFENFNVSSITNNLNKINDFCTLGEQITEQDCGHIAIPQKDEIYTKLCTNREACLESSGRFLDKQPIFANFTDASINENINTVNEFCDTGIALQNGNCNTIVLPGNDTNFTRLCCNGDRQNCDKKCLQSSGEFLNLSPNFANFNDNGITSNLSALNNYCSVGTNLVQQNCTAIINPLNETSFRKYCCNGSVQSDKCQNNPLCLSAAGNFLNKAPDFESFNDDSISVNLNNINQFCKAGNELNNNGCTSITNPNNNNAFKKYCCNNTSICEDNSNCLASAGVFLHKAPIFETFNDNSITSNLTLLNQFCKAGNDLKNNACTSITNPINNTAFRKYCCNNSSVCEDNPACLAAAGVFLDKAPTFANFNDNSIGVNQTVLNSFCEAGNTINKNGCTSIVNPMNNSAYRKYCCNGSIDSAVCLQDNSKGCLVAAGTFLPRDYIMNSFNSNAVSSSVQYILDYCSSGKTLIDGNCQSIVNANNSVSYPKYCSHPDCLPKIGNFQNQDYNLRNLNPKSIAGETANKVTNYCHDGIDMVNQGCTTLTEPRNSGTFRNLCCNGSGDFAACNDTSIRCSIDNSTFLNLSYNLSSTADYQPNWPYFGNEIRSYCLTAKSLANNCGRSVADPQNTYAKFQNYCYDKWPETRL